jgi:hypothetical protein
MVVGVQSIGERDTSLIGGVAVLTAVGQKRESRVGSIGDPSSDASAKPEWGDTHGAGLRYRRSAGS